MPDQYLFNVMSDIYFGYTIAEIINICKNQNAENMIIRPENIQDLKRNHILDTISQILRWDKEIEVILVNNNDVATDRWTYNHSDYFKDSSITNVIKSKQFVFQNYKSKSLCPIHISNEVPKNCILAIAKDNDLTDTNSFFISRNFALAEIDPDFAKMNEALE